MTRCLFCPELGVATTATTTTNDALPFLCVQLGIQSPGSSSSTSTFGGNGGGASVPRPLCRGCHGLWEEVSVLYSNMQGLVNLMTRRVQQFKIHVDKGHDMEGQGKAGCKRKRTAPPSPPPDDDESIISWWYPSSAPVKKKKTCKENPGIDNVVDVGDIVIEGHEIKSEVEDDVVVELGKVGDDGIEVEGDQEIRMEMEEVEIFPEDEGDDDEVRDPSYTPTATPTTSSDHSRGRRNSKGKPLNPEEWEKLLQDVSMLKQTFSNVSNKLDNLAHNQSASSKEPPIVTRPFSDWATFEEFDNSLASDAEKQAKLKRFLYRGGGSKPGEVVGSILRKLFDDKLSVGISFKGLKGNYNYSSTNCCAVMMDLLTTDGKMSEKEIQKAIISWFQHATDRVKSKQKALKP